VQWSPALQHIIEIARKIEPRVRRHVLCTLEGEAYTPDGLSKQWQRLRAGFTMHDMRAKSASDDVDLETATRRLQHSDTRTTMRHYRRKMETVRPLR